MILIRVRKHIYAILVVDPFGLVPSLTLLASDTFQVKALHQPYVAIGHEATSQLAPNP